jgi:hypothetical protein
MVEDRHRGSNEAVFLILTFESDFAQLRNGYLKPISSSSAPTTQRANQPMTGLASNAGAVSIPTDNHALRAER